MAIRLGDTAPDFEAETTEGTIKFHDWKGDRWAVLFSHPKDFTPVCTTELGTVAKIKGEFDKRSVKVIGLSCDPLSEHFEWSKDIEDTQGIAPNFPMIADQDRKVAERGAGVSGPAYFCVLFLMSVSVSFMRNSRISSSHQMRTISTPKTMLSKPAKPPIWTP